MKKIFVILSATALFAACKKENKISETENLKTDSAMVIPENNVPNAVLKEYNFQQVSDLLNKKNDTLYVTNFFATWCGPCVREIPHFKEKMTEMKNQPVKFTFISIDDKADWETKVKEFTKEFGIAENTILMDFQLPESDFFAANFKTWRGETIPFTIIRKGDKTEEINGSISKEELEMKIKKLKNS
jgi:thiol-disulfide isomerase/thioredoxin